MISSFYIHIPFCRQKCLYCKFALTPKYDEWKIRTYISTLKREINEFFKAFPLVSPLSWGQETNPLYILSQEGNIKSIYFGGGTPSILTGEQISEILDVFRNNAILAPNIEITLEANPEDVTSEYIESVAGLWINRLSLGVQTLNDMALRAVGRTLPSSIFRALDMLAKGPIQNISIDLIVGLPHTKSGQIATDLSEIFSRIAPKHISIYMIEDESYPRDWQSYLPGEEMIRDEYLASMEFLEKRDFHRYELSNFAIPGQESRHNQSYWDHSEYRGFGLSAASFLGGKRFANSASFDGYYRGELQDEETLTTESRKIERIMFGMRTSGVLISEIQKADILQKFVSDGLLEIREDRFFPTSTWIFLIDYIIGELI